MPKKISLQMFLLLQYLALHPEYLAYVQDIVLIKTAQQKLIHKNIFSGAPTCFHA